MVDDTHDGTVPQCPVCGEDADNEVNSPERLVTPGRIDEYWEVCVYNDTLYIHNTGIGTYDG